MPASYPGDVPPRAPRPGDSGGSGRGRSGADPRPGRASATGRATGRRETDAKREEPALGSVTELSHTADVGFELRSGDLEGLFEAAADGLAAARGAAADRDAGADVEEVELSRPGLDRLLVAWLRELLHRSMRDDLVAETSVEAVTAPSTDSAAGSRAAAEGGDARLRARVAWRPAADEPVREIKGVTYHGLEVRRGDDGDWHARVVLDV